MAQGAARVVFILQPDAAQAAVAWMG